MPEPTTAETLDEDEVQRLAELLVQAERDGVVPGSRTYARRILAAGYRRVDLTEGHVIEVRKTGWTIMHPVACRPHLFSCEVNRAAERDLTEAPAVLGRFRCDAATGRFAIGAAVGGSDV